MSRWARRGGRAGTGRRYEAVPRAGAALTLAATALIGGLGAGPAATAGASDRPVGGVAAQVLDVATIESEQAQLVDRAFQNPLGAAQFAVASYAATTTDDAGRLDGDRAAQARAVAAEEQATGRLAADRAALTAAVAAERSADTALAGDRARLRSIAVGLYVGDLTNPQPAGVQALATYEKAVMDNAEVDVVAGVVDRTLAADHATALADAGRRRALTAAVGSDGGQLTAAEQATGAAAATVATAEATLAADRGRLAGAQAHLARVQASRAAALAAIQPPAGTPSGTLSLMGGAALDAAQLTAWFGAQGYVDLTSAPVGQLAGWYLDAGRAEGIRGDVAFAQAVLETGGFSSPDAVGLSNFAGIGHCDTCAAGWAFPSPHGGVVGHVQLLRIFADRAPAPAGAPAPVLPVLTPAKQFEAGCCASVESLTGVWATDPTYGAQIVSIYQSMLQFALAQPAT